MSAFAAIEAATATSVLAAFTNCSATLNGTEVTAIFDPEYQDAFGIVGASRAALLLLTASAGSVAVGTRAVITIPSSFMGEDVSVDLDFSAQNYQAATVTWTVAERQDNPPDQGRGWTRLFLK